MLDPRITVSLTFLAIIMKITEKNSNKKSKGISIIM